MINDCRKFRERVTHQSYTKSTPDEYNQSLKVWADVATVYAHIKVAGTPREQAIAHSFRPTTSYILTMLFNNAKPDQRFIWKNHTLNIDGIIPDENEKFMEVYCTEIQ
jgi:SPP1 family predicted phage head-tail adaptor